MLFECPARAGGPAPLRATGSCRVDDARQRRAGRTHATPRANHLGSTSSADAVGHGRRRTTARDRRRRCPATASEWACADRAGCSASTSPATTRSVPRSDESSSARAAAPIERIFELSRVLAPLGLRHAERLRRAHRHDAGHSLPRCARSWTDRAAPARSAPTSDSAHSAAPALTLHGTRADPRSRARVDISGVRKRIRSSMRVVSSSTTRKTRTWTRIRNGFMNRAEGESARQRAVASELEVQERGGPRPEDQRQRRRERRREREPTLPLALQMAARTRSVPPSPTAQRSRRAGRPASEPERARRVAGTNMRRSIAIAMPIVVARKKTHPTTTSEEHRQLPNCRGMRSQDVRTVDTSAAARRDTRPRRRKSTMRRATGRRAAS